MSAREASTLDSEKNDDAGVNGVLDDERELARMGYKQELKYVNRRLRRLRHVMLTNCGGGQARFDANAGECLVLVVFMCAGMRMRASWLTLGQSQNFGVSFSIISVITGIPSLFLYGLVRADRTWTQVEAEIA